MEKQETCGGSAANTISGLARLGVPTGYIGKIGHDPYGEFFAAEMKRHGTEARLFYGASQTGRALGLITPDSERTFATFLGAAVELEATDLSPELFRGYDYFHIEGYMVQNHPLTRDRPAPGQGSRAGSVARPGQPQRGAREPRLSCRRWSGATWTSCSPTRTSPWPSAARTPRQEALVTISPQCRIAVVKLGKNGSLVRHKEERHEIGCIPAQAIDTTGAGDLYAAGFLYGLIQGYPLPVCGRIGSLLSGKVVEVVGAKLDEAQMAGGRGRAAPAGILIRTEISYDEKQKRNRRGHGGRRAGIARSRFWACSAPNWASTGKRP